MGGRSSAAAERNEAFTEGRETALPDTPESRSGCSREPLPRSRPETSSREGRGKRRRPQLPWLDLPTKYARALANAEEQPVFGGLGAQGRCHAEEADGAEGGGEGVS